MSRQECTGAYTCPAKRHVYDCYGAPERQCPGDDCYVTIPADEDMCATCGAQSSLLSDVDRILYPAGHDS